VLRLLCMSAQSFEAFCGSVLAWRPGVSKPCCTARAAALTRRFETLWLGLSQHVLAARRDALPTPDECIAKYLQVRDSFMAWCT
jgi:hypothetical protein